MVQTSELLPEQQHTQHAMLIAWGQFAQEIGLREQLATVPMPQKTVQHTPAAKLATLFMGLARPHRLVHSKSELRLGAG
jgi:hypothetical protein